MLDGDGLLVYVGKAKHLRGRLFSYFRPRSRDPKAGRIVRIARTIVWEYQPSEFAALLRELELIQRWQPRLNIHGQPLRRLRTYICLGRKPAPYAFLARRPPAGALASFGPVPAGRKAREAVRWINDWFGLRDCCGRRAACATRSGPVWGHALLDVRKSHITMRYARPTRSWRVPALSL
jgi:excinuclease ABC subunit C